jgi:alpha-1,6-mannosyltransferase
MGESFGLVIVESMSCGTPVVATTSAASPERVLPGTGVLCAPDDPHALASACLEGLALSAEPGIRERCRAAAAPYDWDAMLPEYERIYQGAV